MSRRPAAVALAAALALVPAAPGPSGATTIEYGCSTFAVSPAWDTDGTAFCAALPPYQPIEPRLYVTTDRGRTWRRASASGLVVDPTSHFLFQPQLSPSYPTDRTFVVATNRGVFTSTDRAETFRLVTPLFVADRIDNPFVFARPATDPFGARGPSGLYAVRAFDERSARVDLVTGLYQPVLGAVAQADLFVLPARPGGTATPLALVREDDRSDPQRARSRIAVWRCTEDLSCTERAFAFPLDHAVGRVHLVPRRGGGTDVVAVVTRNDRDVVQFWRSTDGGRTFARWAPVDALVRPFADFALVRPQVSLAFHERLPGRLYLRVRGGYDPKAGWAPSAPPAEQIFRSDDGGTTWRRVGWQRDGFQPGRRGPLPWDAPGAGGGADAVGLALAPDGRLFTGGTRNVPDRLPEQAIFCSVDGGVRWSRGCPR